MPKLLINYLIELKNISLESYLTFRGLLIYTYYTYMYIIDISMAETESEMTAAVNAVAKRANLTKHMSVVAVKKAQEGVKGVLDALK
nr:hypothetical protein BSM_16790 [uncultured archaeon]